MKFGRIEWWAATKRSGAIDRACVLTGGMPLRIVSGFEYAALDYAAGEMFIAPLSDEAGVASLVIICLYIKPRRHMAADDEAASVPDESAAQKESPARVAVGAG